MGYAFFTVMPYFATKSCMEAWLLMPMLPLVMFSAVLTPPKDKRG